MVPGNASVSGSRRRRAHRVVAVDALDQGVRRPGEGHVVVPRRARFRGGRGHRAVEPPTGLSIAPEVGLGCLERALGAPGLVVAIYWS